MRITDTLVSGLRRTSPRHTGWAVAARLPRGLALAVCLLVAGVAVQAQTAFNYNASPRTFRACRLLMPYYNGTQWVSQASGDNRSLMFEGMRRYPDKPSGWDIVNPLAPPTLVAGDPSPAVLPSTARYWEVALDPHPDLIPTGPTALSLPYPNYNGPQLDKFDLIYVHIGGQDAAGNDMVLNLQRPEWRATLLRAVYNGAVLWIDQKRDNNGTVVTQFAPPGTVLDLPGPPFWMTWANPAAGWARYAAANAGANTLAKDRLLSYPFLLQNVRDIPYLGSLPTVVGGPASVDQIVFPDPTAASAAQLADATSWQPVVNVGNGVATPHPNIAVARCGAGAIVLSAGDVGYDVIDWWFGADPHNRPLQQQAADCKFAWNVAALAGSFAQAQGNGPAQGASVTATPPPLGINWQYPDRFDASGLNVIGPVVGAPVVNKGMAYVVSLPVNGNPARLMCFDADPAADLDGDGNADDGIQDYSLGRSYDMVWSVDLPAGTTPRTAGPCVATMLWPQPLVAATTQTDVVLVSVVETSPGAGAAGQVRAYNAHTGADVWTRTLRPYTVATGRVVDLSAPVVYRDTVFVLASEYDAGIDDDAGATATEGSYGRVHAFGMNYDWSTGTVGPQWVYPDRNTDPSHAQDADNTGGAPTDHATPESGRSLPPFQDPAWVAAMGSAPGSTPEIPPYPTSRPTVAMPSGALVRPGVDVVLQCSTPVSLTYAAAGSGTNVTNLDPTVGGSDYVFLPSPYDASDPLNPRYTLNRHAFGVWLPQGATAALTRFFNANTAVHREDDANITSVGNAPSATEFTWRDPADGRVYADFLPGAAREFLLPSLN
ncbi:MAG: hypothetical protein WCP21_08300, partial [Armatimonadota bacterium]